MAAIVAAHRCPQRCPRVTQPLTPPRVRRERAPLRAPLRAPHATPGAGTAPDTKRTLQRHDLPNARLHDLRHFRASALISTGADIAAVSKAMGHKTIAITSDLYGNLFDKAGREMAERAAGIVPRQRRPQDENKIPNNSPTISSETINDLAG